MAVGLGGCVPVFAGLAGVVLGPGMLGPGMLAGGAPGLDAAGDSHFRYLSGLLLGIGLGFWSTIPALPRRGARFRLLTAIVVLGGLARLAALPLQGWPGWPMVAALGMELVVTPLLCLFQARFAAPQRD
ncbi:DUF4345 domain-containing protein [Falsiroseomonas tokyonensis]|uniref:DUF4345 domain-containing protein n=1 Tax=Falsiroseomonas tokyonensis TaxID=430521 RepID=A0ABV7BWP8_9PROT|nr:DUF4345 domain-containing protein [Falsiroseomonas tokyonensis]